MSGLTRMTPAGASYLARMSQQGANTVAGMGGLLTLDELRSVNAVQSPPDFPATVENAYQENAPGALSGLGQRRDPRLQAMRRGGATQGTWLSPSQAAQVTRESSSKLASEPQRFSLSGGLGERSRAVAVSSLRRGEFETNRQLRDSPEVFGMGRLPARRGRIQVQRDELMAVKAMRQAAIARARQGGICKDEFAAMDAAVAASKAAKARARQVKGQLRSCAESQGVSFDRAVSASEATMLNEALSGLGQMSPQAAAQIAMLQQQAGSQLSRMYMGSAIPTASQNIPGPQYPAPQAQGYYEPAFNMAPICNPQTKKCIRYAAPPQAAIESAYRQGNFELPAFYQHPQLGPWGVDPQQAYQYWAAQQAALMAAPYATPMTVWGSPGMVAAQVPPLGQSQTAQTAAYDPYTTAFPIAGEAVEQF